VIIISQFLISYIALGVSIISVFLAIKFNSKWYWVATLGMYTSSYLGLGIEGLYYFNLVFVLLALAAFHSLGLIKRLLHSVIAVMIGLICWMVTVSVVGHYWLF
jgi:hypothetical protein